MTTTFRDFVSALHEARLTGSQPVIAHASLSAFGYVRGDYDTLIGALTATSSGLIMPAFTTRCELIPESGPEDNALEYGSGKDANRLAEFFSPDLPADTMIGKVAETLRRHPQAHRSNHPLLSFTGIRCDAALEAQTLTEPLAPVRTLAEADGWVALLGVDQTVNTSIHYAETLAGQKQFIRWALTPDGVRECQAYPGCSDGFNALTPHLNGALHTVKIGESTIQTIRLADLISTVRELLTADPLALLCDRPDCPRCNTVRRLQNRS